MSPPDERGAAVDRTGDRGETLISREGMVVIGGLPGTGKSTIATPLTRRLGAAYLRIDTVEQALVDSRELPARPVTAGYGVGYAVARDQLRVGLTVVVAHPRAGACPQRPAAVSVRAAI